MTSLITDSHSPLAVSKRLSPAFSRPVWWAALAALILNDHLLKGAGWLPGWFTGKLSDFAFLLVAPAIAHSLLPARVSIRRLLAILGIAVPFALGKAVPAFTHLLESAVRVAGIPWRLWTDPTDLVALVMLPVSWTLLARRSRHRPTPGGQRDLIPRAGVALGALACVATSALPGEDQVRPFVRNASTTAAQVQVQWLLKSAGCAVPLSEIARDLRNGDLSDPTSIRLVPDAFAAVDMPPQAGISPVGSCSNDPKIDQWADLCPVVLVQASGLRPVLARSSGRVREGQSDTPVCVPGLWAEDRPAGEIRIEDRASGDLRWVAADHVEMIDFAIPASWSSSPPPAGSCQAIAADYARVVAEGQNCAIDADCQPVSDKACVAVNVSAVAGAEVASAAYSQAGCAYPPATCEPNHPAICNAGQCEIDCPNVPFAACPPACSAPVRSGDVCSNDQGYCLNDAGERCRCAHGDGTATVECEPPFVPFGCQSWCL